MLYLRRVVLVPAVASLVALAGCTAETAGSPEAAQAASEDVTSSTSDAYLHLVSRDANGRYTIELANGGPLKCANGATAKTCTADALVLPPDCDWECTDGLLSFQGEPVVRGRLANVTNAKTHAKVATLTIDAGFDTFERGLGAHPIYRLTASATCAHDPCPGTMTATKLNATTTSTVHSVDFTNAADPNFVLDPAMGYAKLTTDAGLLVSGTIDHGAFRADRVFRLWTPKPACDPEIVAQGYWLNGDEYTATREFLTTAEAERFTDPNGLENKWLVRTAESKKLVTFTGGENDLWAVTFTVDKASCALTLTGEH